MKTIPKADPPVASVSLPQVQKIVRNYGFCRSLHAGKFYAILSVSDIAKAAGRGAFQVSTDRIREKHGLASLIGDRAFYRKVMIIVMPIIVQNAITNFVGMLDNIMVGQVGTEPMSGVAITNQLMFVFNICVFGIVAGAGILGAQFYGSGNYDGMRHTFRFKLAVGCGLTAAFLVVFAFWGDNLIQAFLHEGSGEGDLEMTLEFGRDYLHVMMVGLLPFALVQAYAGTLRESGQTVVPMTAGIVAVLVNLIFNYILIFGKFGAPALGVVGAAAAYGEEALKVATTVKLTRALWIIPLSIVSIFIFQRKKGEKTRISIPWFIFLFILAMLANSFIGIPEALGKGISIFSHKALSVTLFLIGTGLSVDSIKKTGIKPVLLGIVLWILISVASLAAVLL